jgi:hypothetical protein
MKLAPIRNPHSKTSKIEKLTKREEKVLLLQKTKQEVLQKFSNNKMGAKGLKKPLGAITTGQIGVK